MGAKQSSPAPSGRTRAYSGSDLPSHTSSSSSNGSSRSVGGAGAAAASTSGQSSGLAATSGGRGAAAALSPSGRLHLVSPPPPPPPAPLVPPPAAGGFRSAAATSGRNQSVSIPNSGGTCSSQEESEGSTPEERTPERPGGHGSAPRLLIGSLPAHLSPHLFGVSPTASMPTENSIISFRVLNKKLGMSWITSPWFTHCQVPMEPFLVDRKTGVPV
ncbi:E3 ubiquitin-protein ligase ZNRF2-like isoform X2 [Chiloscyllium plagiosum]|uniref:E3 ubiquitin-protein ligase ZNRF2-like isoform X2 n=1 Tax=Chiloscyllium plagiosum TaxID=36176 RepID=UPI001CB7E488|nr:E3 ubiquitin-protein ligase ZNRF2-like isoform X2 [Chiloscyllium plagiosum]